MVLRAPTSRILPSNGFHPPRGIRLPTRWSALLSTQTLAPITSQNSSHPKLLARLSQAMCQQVNPRRKVLPSQARPCLTLFHLSMHLLRHRSPSANLPRPSPISKAPLSRSKIPGHLSSTPSASLLTIFLNSLALPKLLSHRRLTRSPLLIGIPPTKRRPLLSQFSPRPHLAHSLQSPPKLLLPVLLHQRSALPFVGMFKYRNPLWDRKSVLHSHMCLQAQPSEKKKVRQVLAGAGRDTKVVATVDQDPRLRPSPVPCKRSQFIWEGAF